MTTATPPNSTAAALSEQKFNKLKAKLRELFELDKSDLDFGIYRIMAAKNTEVTDFLDRRVRGVVQQTLAEHESGQADEIQAELDEKIAGLKSDGLDEAQIEAYPAVKTLRERLRDAGGKTGEELEADVYNHLLAFFSRYYDEGDFISQRRYKGDTYAIPYSGEEVTLHWANKDQYYIKSGEWHKDYRFKLPSGKRVRFALIDATQDPNNVKESDDSKRRYVLLDDEPVAEEDGSLVLRFAFRTPTEDEKARAGDGAVAIFGGKYEKTTKGDERTQFCADAERRALADAPDAWRKALSEPSPTDDKPARTVLGKHLDHFTARNTFDYFIHKDLGGFLRRELDFYIKNEVVRLDDLDDAAPGALARVQGRVKAIRRVASSVIDLLASIEDFQKKLWLKKKFVLNTSWLVTVDRIPEKLRDSVANNKAQWEEWERLGFKPETEDAAGLFGGAKWGTRAYLDACDKLVVDTRLFDEGFTSEVLASEEVLDGDEQIEDALTGVLVNGENLSSVRLLDKSFREQLALLYCDPPYNTGDDGFNYKDGWPHSSWMSMLQDRLHSALELVSTAGAIAVNIDDNEAKHLWLVMDNALGVNNYVSSLVWKRRSASGMSGQPVSLDHEYIILYAKDIRRVSLRGLDKDESGYPHFDEQRQLRYASTDLTIGATRQQRPNQFYSITNPRTGSTYEANPQRVWRFFPETMEQVIRDDLVIWPDEADGNLERPRYKTFFNPDEIKQKPLSSWISSATDEVAIDDDGDDVEQLSSGMNAEGGRVLERLFGLKVFAYPKPLSLGTEIVRCTTTDASWVADVFAGSGTTGHALLSQIRVDGVNRRMLLIELGEYFQDILVPRVKKVIYSSDWKTGKAQSHDQGLSALVKCFAVESYEDALNNLPTPEGEFLPGQDGEKKDALLRYALDLQLGPHLLDLDAFRDPWGYEINAQLAGEDEVKRRRVDLVETFNYLLGLKVSAYGPRERYSAEFETAEHEEGLGRVKVKGRLKKDADGPYAFHRVEGVLNDGADTRVLVVWRTLTDDPEKDAAVLQAWMDRHRETTTERSEHREYQLIYINGPVTLPQPTSEIRTVHPIEETFKKKMFEDTDESGLG